MKLFVVLIASAISACASQAPEPAQDFSDIQVFLEDPSIDYETLGRVDETSRAEHPAEVLEKVLGRAAQLGANGVIVHAVRNQGRIARGNDIFGTGGGFGYSLYQIQATAIRYVE